MYIRPIVIHWFRRDLRIDDNTALAAALRTGMPVMPIFIFDSTILDKLEDKNDRRVTFIADQLAGLDKFFRERGGALRVYFGRPADIFRRLFSENTIAGVFCNEDYEPYARERDTEIAKLAAALSSRFVAVKDHVIFSPAEVIKDDGSPYQVFTPYSRRWIEKFSAYLPVIALELPRGEFMPAPPDLRLLSLADIGFVRNPAEFPAAKIDESLIANYDKTRDLPALTGTSRLGMHLRFGTISVRYLALRAYELNHKYLAELIWREFYQMILWFFPQTVSRPFREAYAKLKFPGSRSDFEIWCRGETGYPLVDAGMHELTETGFMHNRVRMVAASFLTKHLLCDWRWGERFFARHLNDFELASNVGGWQWCAGIGADAAPYFRIFNPSEQQKKFDPQGDYIARWNGRADDFFGTPMDTTSEGVRAQGSRQRPEMVPMIDHRFARERCLKFFSAVRP